MNFPGIENLTEFFSDGVAILSFTMLLLALTISTARTVNAMISFYQVQCLVLAFITVLTPFSNFQDFDWKENGILIICALIPLTLFWVIRPLLAQVTVAQDLPVLVRLRRLFWAQSRNENIRLATPVWLQQRSTRGGEILTFLVDLVLILLAYIGSDVMQEAFLEGATDNLYQITGLATSMSLLLLGLSTMIRKADIVAQVIGLLVMEHGMFLGAISLKSVSNETTLFVISLFLYTIITLTLLVILLPELSQASGSIDIRDQNKLRG